MRRRSLYFFLVFALIFSAIAAMSMHRNVRSLRTELHIEQADIGIPGVTKMYRASITNFGHMPVRITRCDFIDDAMAHSVDIAYAIQRWDQKSNQWQQISTTSPKTFCRPYPLGIIQSKLRRVWLWPGQSLSTEEEATAATGALGIGDRVRFVVFPDEPGNYSSSIATREFIIDEHPTSDVDFRIRH